MSTRHPRHFSVHVPPPHPSRFEVDVRFDEVLQDWPYVYEWKLGVDGRLAVLQDWDPKDYRTSTSVYRLSKNISALEASLIERNTPEDGTCGLSVCAVHPKEPKMMLLGANELTFFDFETCEFLSPQ
jgi:hypothetical protein